jgi:hypothetical protein
MAFYKSVNLLLTGVKDKQGGETNMRIKHLVVLAGSLIVIAVVVLVMFIQFGTIDLWSGYQ